MQHGPEVVVDRGCSVELGIAVSRPPRHGLPAFPMQSLLPDPCLATFLVRSSLVFLLVRLISNWQVISMKRITQKHDLPQL
jgi:hypothetical protein